MDVESTMKPLETSGNRPQRFPADFRILLLIKVFEKMDICTNKEFGYLPETTTAEGFLQVSG